MIRKEQVDKIDDIILNKQQVQSQLQDVQYVDELEPIVREESETHSRQASVLAQTQNNIITNSISSKAKIISCDIHPEEQIKYYCRDDKVGICPECVVLHAKHDFIFADETAAQEIKQNL